MEKIVVKDYTGTLSLKIKKDCGFIVIILPM